MAKHMAWTVLGDLLITAHDEGPPADSEWRAWLQDYESHIERLRGNIVHSTGGGPTSSQRKELLNVLGRHERVPPTVIMTSSALMRGLVTAVGWFLPPERRPMMFSVDEVGPALDFLRLEPPARAAARDEIERLRTSIAVGPRMAASGRVEPP
jgi:hypothetical protein